MMSVNAPSAALQVPLENYTAAISDGFPKVNPHRMVESTIFSRQTQDILPVNSSINNKFKDSYIEFRIPGVKGQFIDLSSLTLELMVELTGPDGITALADIKNASIVNGLSQTMFKAVTVYLNEQVVETNSLFSYLSYVKLMTTLSECKAERFKELTYFYNDVFPEKYDVDYFKNASEDLKSRFVKLKTEGVNCCFKLLLDITTLSEYLLDGIDIRLRLELNSDPWVINSIESGYKFNIKLARMWIDRITPFASGLEAINRALAEQNTPVTYTFDKTLHKTFILGNGQQRLSIDQPWGSIIPDKLFIMMMDMEAISGAYTLNPLYFDHCDLSNVYITRDGTNLFNITCKFPNKCSKLYYETQNTVGFNACNTLTYNSFIKGRTLLAFRLTPEELRDTLPIEASGNLRITLEFAVPAKSNKVIILFGITTGVLRIYSDRRVVCDTRA